MSGSKDAVVIQAGETELMVYDAGVEIASGETELKITGKGIKAKGDMEVDGKITCKQVIETG